MAKPPAQKLTQTLPEQRAGEGHPISVQITDSGDGKHVLQANLDQAPVPSKQYVADIAFVDFQRETILMYFAQELTGGEGLRNLLIAHIAPLNVVRFLAIVEDIRKPSIQEAAARMGVKAAAATAIKSEPKDTVALSVTAGMVGLSGRDACIDFFSASPFSIGMAQRAGKLAIDPVVRINLRTSLLLSLVEQLRDVLGRVPDKLKSD